MYENYLLDLGLLLTEKVVEVKKEKLSATVISEYDHGYQMALYEIVTLMQQQALAFQIGLDKINLDKINPDVDIL